jgi:hypothetical protein
LIYTEIPWKIINLPIHHGLKLAGPKPSWAGSPLVKQGRDSIQGAGRRQWPDPVSSGAMRWVGEMADEVGDPFGAAGRRGAHR